MEPPPREPASAPPPDPGPPAAPPKASLRRRSLEGMFWTLLSVGGGQVVRFGSNLVLTRLLVPEHFAVMALVNTVLSGLRMFSDVGIRPSIIQNERGDEPAFLNTAWSLQVVRGIVLWALTLVLAWPVALIYDVPLLASLLPVAGLTAVLDGFSATSLATLHRRLKLRPIVLLEFITQVAGIVVMVVWAWFYPSPWALVGGAVFGRAMMLVASFRLETAIRHRFMFEREARLALIHFGRWIFISTAITFLAAQSDRLILGKLFPLALFGVFNIAVNISNLPGMVLNKVSGLVLMPAISEMKSRPRHELRATLVRVRWKPCLLMMAGLAFGASIADYMVRFLYEENYWDAAWMVPILVAGTAITVLLTTSAPALIALGKPKFTALSVAARFVYLVVGLPVGFSIGGPPMAVTVLAFAEIPVWIATAWGLSRQGLGMLRQDLTLVAAFGLFLSAFLGTRFALGLGLPWAG